MKHSSLKIAIHKLCTYSVPSFFLTFTFCLYSFAVNTEDQITDSVNKKLRTVNEKGEMDENKATVAEVLVYKNESKALDQLNKLLGKYKGSPLEASLLFRKAELFVRQSKSARYFEFTREDKKLTLLPKTVKLSSSISKLQGAVDIYEQIQKKHPDYSDLDLVMFNNAFVRQQLNQEKQAEKIYRDILKKFPESYLVPDTYMSLAEMLYRNRRFQDALVEYEAIKKYPLARVYTYALYKNGWTKYQLRDVVGAIHELEAVIRVSEQNLIGEGGSKISLITEALTDLVLFYPEAYEAKKAFAYFKKLAGNNAGEYLVSLSRLYEGHSRYGEFEVVLNDLINGLPNSEYAPVAFKSLIDSDLNLKNYKTTELNIIRLEKHCNTYTNNSNSLENPSCMDVLVQQSLKIASKWHKDWQNKIKKILEATKSINQKDADYLNQIAQASETSYQVHLRNSKKTHELELIRFNYAELLFARKKYRESAEQYYLASLNMKDPTKMHDSSYYSIVSLESAVGDKWTDSDEEKYLLFSKNYLDKNPKGKYSNDILFKRSFIAYEKNRLDEAQAGFKKLGWNSSIDQKISIRAQDLYLDILNIKKDYPEIMKASMDLFKTSQSSERKLKLEKLNQESSFAYASVLMSSNKLEAASDIYEGFYKNHSKSNLADKALWNLSQIYIKQNKISLAAEKLFELYNHYPKSVNALIALEKSIELYEYTGQTNKVAQVAYILSKMKIKENLKWLKVAADFNLISGDQLQALVIYKELLKNPDEKLRSDVIAKLKRIENPGTELSALVSKYSQDSISEINLKMANKKLLEKKYSESFRLASQILGDKFANNYTQAQARFIQAEILFDEFFSQSVKSKIDKIEIVLTLKTEKLDKAQRAFQSVIKYGVPEVSSMAYLKLAKLYTHYVESLKKIQITEDISEKDRDVLMAEIEKITMPIEEKISDTLVQGMEFVKKYPVYGDVGFELRNEFSKINFKGERYVKFNISHPKTVLPVVN